MLALWNTMIATSVLSLPWAVRESGLLCGVVSLVVMGAIMGYTCYLVLISVDKLAGGQMLEFHDVCRHYLGRQAKVVAMTGSLLTLLGGMIVYWVLLASFLFHIGNFIHDQIYDVHDDAFNISQQHGNAVCRLWNVSSQRSVERNGSDSSREFGQWWSQTRTVPLYLVPVLFSLLNFKSATMFARMNSLGMLSLVYLAVCVAVKANTWGINLDLRPDSPDSSLYNSHYAPQFRLSFPALTGVAALGFFVQNSVLSLVRNQKHPQHNTRDLILAYVMAAVTYIYIGGIFYVTYPFNKQCIVDNLLENIASHDILGLVARACLLFQLICIFPQLAYITRIQLFTFIYGKPWPSVYHVVTLNVALVTICVLFAVFLPHVGRIISFVGALCGFYYAIGLPCLVHCMSLREDGELTFFKLLFHLLLVLIGLANFVSQFFVMDHL